VVVFYTTPVSNDPVRKSQAATGAVAERQQVEQLTREQKTQSRTLGNLHLKWDEFVERKATLQQEWETWSEAVKEVCPFPHAAISIHMPGRQRRR
jgi:hypothetical protein